jgi:hypothetical protein
MGADGGGKADMSNCGCVCWRNCMSCFNGERLHNQPPYEFVLVPVCVRLQIPIPYFAIWLCLRQPILSCHKQTSTRQKKKTKKKLFCPQSETGRVAGTGMNRTHKAWVISIVNPRRDKLGRWREGVRTTHYYITRLEGEVIMIWPNAMVNQFKIITIYACGAELGSCYPFMT